MSINSLKKLIIEKINDTNDEEMLTTIYRMLDHAQGVYQLSQEELMAIEEARAQYKRGEFITDEELQKEFDKWLN